VSGTDALRQRLAAILAADVAGYSRLMAADERGTVAALEAARALFRGQIESNQGRVIDMAGDSVLAVFDTASGAVAAALAIQQSLHDASSDVPEERRMRFRIGVHLGDVIEKADGSVYGDGVNIAARLEGLAEPGGVTISESVRTAVKGRVLVEFDDLGAQTVKNIAEPVRAYRVKPAETRNDGSRSSAGGRELPALAKPSIAVLPFNNISGDPEQEFFADGMVEDILTTLSKIPDLIVISRNSSITYKGRPVDVRSVGRELQVLYVVEGSVRKAGNRVRVTAQLVSCADGRHLWADRYDGDLDDVFRLQDQITREIVSALQVNLTDGEQARIWLSRSGSPMVWEKYLTAGQLYRHFEKQSHLRAQRELEEALRINPTYLPALETLGYVFVDLARFGWTSDRPNAYASALQCAARALEIDPCFGNAYSVIGYAKVFQRNFDEAIDAAETAVRLSPNSAYVSHMSAMVHIYAGNFRVGKQYEEQFARLNPISRDISLVDAARASYHLADYAVAQRLAEQVLKSRPLWLTAQTILLASLWRLGRTREGTAIKDEILKTHPRFSISRWSQGFPYRRSQDLDDLMDPLLQAGLPQ